MKKNLSPEEQQALAKQKKKNEKREFTMAVVSGSILYSVIGLAVAFLCKAIALKFLGAGLVIYSIFQLVYVLSHKQMSQGVTRFFIIMNIVPYFLFSISTW